jgi:hypothetical protein
METDKELTETTEPRPWTSWLKGICWIVLILALLAVLGVFVNRGKMASKLQETLAELDRSDPGWRLEEIEAARADIPDEENSAPVVVAAAEQMPRPWPSKDFVEENFQNLPPTEMLSDDDFVQLSKELARARAALETAGKLSEMPRGRHRIYYASNPLATLLPDVQKSRDVVRLLVYEAQRCNQEGESKKALTACRAALNAGRSIGDEPIYISQLVRTACVTIACRAIERTLAQGEPPPEDMGALQKLLENEDAFPGLLIATRGERASRHQVFAGVERGEISLKDLEGGTGIHRGDDLEDWLKNTALSFWRMDTRSDDALFLSLMARRLKEVQRPLHEQADLEKQFEQDVRALPQNACITRMLLPAISKIGEAFRRKHALLRCTIVALAAERYRRDKKAWPDKIDQLCPQYLASVPLDPFDGKPLRYRRVKDRVVIYSVGPDGVDNGGNLDREHNWASSGTDIGVRLWDVSQRRQSAKPKPAQPPQGPMPPL